MPNAITNQTIKRIRELVKERVPYKVIAADLGVSRFTVGKYATELNERLEVARQKARWRKPEYKARKAEEYLRRKAAKESMNGDSR